MKQRTYKRPENNPKREEYNTILAALAAKEGVRLSINHLAHHKATQYALWYPTPLEAPMRMASHTVTDRELTYSKLPLAKLALNDFTSLMRMLDSYYKATNTQAPDGW